MAIRVVCLLLLAVNAASALKCYDCDSSVSGTCEYGVLSFFADVVECGGWMPSCATITATDSYRRKYVARGCVPLGKLGSCELIAETMNVFRGVSGDLQQLRCSTCDTDKCNSAVQHGGYAIMAAVVMTTLAMALR